jgi:hypothetical protein
MFTFQTLDGLLESVAKNNKPMFNTTQNLSFSPTFSQYYIDEMEDGVGNYVAYSEYNNYPNRGLPFHRDWNYLMLASTYIKNTIPRSNSVEFLEDDVIYIDEWSFGMRAYFIKLIKYTGGSFKTDVIHYNVGSDAESDIEAMFMVLSDVAKLYNENV